TIWYYFSARDTLGRTAYWSQTAGVVHDEAIVRSNPMEVTCLPANALTDSCGILYVDDEGYTAHTYFAQAFEELGITPDRYDVNQPGYALGNGLGSRVVDVAQQLASVYKTIIWNSGKWSDGTIGDGSGNPDKADDFRILYEFIDQGPGSRGLYISGDGIGEEWVSLTGTYAADLRSDYMGFDLLNGDHVAAGQPISPLVVGQPTSSFYHAAAPDTVVAYGGCPVINTFDVLTPTGNATLEMAYSNNPAHGAVIAQETPNQVGGIARVFLSGFSFHYMRDDRPAATSDQTHHLYDILRGLYAFPGDSVLVTVATDPPGLSIDIDGTPYTSPQQFNSLPGSVCSLSAGSKQYQGDTLHVYINWSDGGDTTHTATIPYTDTTFTAFYEPLFEHAMIDSVVDVANDQGGWVYVYFRRSLYDFADEDSLPVTGYTLYRRVDDAAVREMIRDKGTPIDTEVDWSLAEAVTSLPRFGDNSQLVSWDDHYYLVSDGSAANSFPPGVWAVVVNAPGHQQQHYIALAPTLVDSSATVSYSVYTISAETTTPSVYFVSPPDSGYSVDNIAPAEPHGFCVTYNSEQGNVLNWGPSQDNDFLHFNVYREATSGAPEGPQGSPSTNASNLAAGTQTLVHSTTATSWTDPVPEGWRYSYSLSVVDIHGNESDRQGPEDVTGIEDFRPPKTIALYQNVPNPFNPTTVIRYDIDKDGTDVSLIIFDVGGRLVRTLVDEPQDAGKRTVRWEGKDARGNTVSSGVYFYRLTAGNRTLTKKMVLLK
ncbi:MAG: T9SS type A sorting domain-containing protein, partial [Candidatus Latescibacterota bacterium]